MKFKWMKKILAGALSAALCCGMLTGCGKGVEQTNEELNVYVSENEVDSINYPLRLYQSKYPDVRVNLNIIAEDAEDMYYDDLKSSLMTGKDIPDLLIIDSLLTEHCDIYKTEQTGAFIDLNPLLSEDPWYDASKYNDGVVKGLEYDGKQYIYPIAYHLPYVASTKENLEEIGITVENFQSLTVLDFFQLLKEKQKEYGLSIPELVSGSMSTEKDHIKDVYASWYSPNVVDYKKQSFSVQTDEMQSFVESVGVLEECVIDGGNYDGYLYANPCGDEIGLQWYAREKAHIMEEEIVLTCLRDMNGKINAYVWFAAAIPQLSPNQQNAYDFLQILLSEDVQDYRSSESMDLKYGDYRAYDFVNMLIPIMNGATFCWYDSLFAGSDYDVVRNADFAYREEVSGSFLYSEWSKLIMEQAEEYYKGNCSAEQAVESVEKKLKIYVSE